MSSSKWNIRKTSEKGDKEWTRHLLATKTLVTDSSFAFTNTLVSFLVQSIVIVLLCSLIAFVLTLKKKRQRYKRELKARKLVKDSINAEFTTVESGSFEWINLLLRHQYKCVLSQIADEHAKRVAVDILKTVNNNTDINAAEKKKNKKHSFIGEVSLEDFSLGTTPPTVNLYVARYNPKADYVQFECDFDWDTNASHARIQAQIKPGMYLKSLNVPVHITNLSIHGKLIMGMRLVSREPGVSGVDVSFRDTPTVDVSVSPMGLPVSDIPGLHDWVISFIQSAIQKDFVEPRRMYVDVEHTYMKIAKKAQLENSNGILVVRVMKCTNLVNRNISFGYPYASISYRGRKARTATRPWSKRIEWGSRHEFDLPAFDDGNDDAEDNVISNNALNRISCGEVSVKILDRTIVGSILKIGEATFKVNRSKVVNGKKCDREAGMQRVDIDLDVHGASNRHKKAQITIEWEVVDANINEQPTQRDSSGDNKYDSDAESDASEDAFDDAEKTGVLDGDYEEEKVNNDATTTRTIEDFNKSASSRENGNASSLLSSSGKAISPSRRLFRATGSDLMDSTPTSATIKAFSSSNSPSVASTTSHLLHTAKLQRMLKDERDRFNDKILDLKQEVEDAREEVELWRERRSSELRRAILEGAVFISHTKYRKLGLRRRERYRFYYNTTNNTLNWTSPSSKFWFFSQRRQTLLAEGIADVQTGFDNYTIGQNIEKMTSGNKGRMKAERATHGLNPKRCFSIILRETTEHGRQMQGNENESVQAASKGSANDARNLEKLRAERLLTIDLELPKKGNGRSAREWQTGIIECCLKMNRQV